MSKPGTRVGPLSDLPSGELASAEVDGEKVVLANVDGTVYALRDECSHEEAPLSEGELDDAAIECPWHFSRFCVRTGEVLDPPAISPVQTYRVEVIDGDMYVTGKVEGS